MPISTVTRSDIVTIPLVAATNIVTYDFEFTVPVPPVTTGKSQAQVLWIQLTYAADATVGLRIPVFDLFDDTGASVYSIASINTQPAGSLVVHSLLQGVVIFPLSILGFMRTFPVNGLYAFDGWSLSFRDFVGISAGDTIAGFMQLRIS